MVWIPLAVWALLLGGWRLWRYSRPATARGRLLRVAKRLLAITVSILVVLPIVVFPPYHPLDPTGDHAVATATRTVDGITLGIWYPEGASDPLPLVVFSHGSMGVRDSNLSLYLDLASHGYLVVSPDHPGHALMSKDMDGHRSWIDRGYLDELRREDASADPEGSLISYRKWMGARIADLESVIDAVASGSDPELPQVDPERIGLVGHSLGGSAVLGLGRVRQGIEAVVALEAPYLADIVGVEDGRFVWDPDPYPVPVLHVYTDSAWGHLDEWPQYRRNVKAFDDPTVRNVHLEGVGHLHLTDLSLSSPILTRILNGHPSSADPRETLRDLNRLIREFLDRHLLEH